MANPDAPEAAEWVAREIKRLRSLSFEELETLEGQPEHWPMHTAAGKPLMLETQVWDDRENTHLRVTVDVWDPAGRISIGSIAKDDFIRTPDGSFVGEWVRSEVQAALGAALASPSSWTPAAGDRLSCSNYNEWAVLGSNQ